MNNPFMLTIFYRSFPNDDDTVREHNLQIDKRNIVANTKELIDMINGDSLIGAKQHLGKVLALVMDFQLDAKVIKS